jgi:hypothetical protein
LPAQGAHKNGRGHPKWHKPMKYYKYIGHRIKWAHFLNSIRLPSLFPQFYGHFPIQNFDPILSDDFCTLIQNHMGEIKVTRSKRRARLIPLNRVIFPTKIFVLLKMILRKAKEINFSYF